MAYFSFQDYELQIIDKKQIGHELNNIFSPLDFILSPPS
jgi:hypothetical protein